MGDSAVDNKESIPDPDQSKSPMQNVRTKPLDFYYQDAVLGLRSDQPDLKDDDDQPEIDLKLDETISSAGKSDSPSSDGMSDDKQETNSTEEVVKATDAKIQEAETVQGSVTVETGGVHELNDKPLEPTEQVEEEKTEKENDGEKATENKNDEKVQPACETYDNHDRSQQHSLVIGNRVPVRDTSPEISDEVVTITVLPKDESDKSAEESQESTNSNSFLIIENSSTPKRQESTEEIKTEIVEPESPPKEVADDETFKEIESLVAAFDGSEDAATSKSEPVDKPVQKQTSPQTSKSPKVKAEAGKKSTKRKLNESDTDHTKSSKVSEVKKSTKEEDKKSQRAKRTGGPPTKKEGSSSIKNEALAVVGNGKLRVHGYEKVNEQTGLPELVMVNREILERIISDQEKQMQQMKSKLKEVSKMCDDLRKVVLNKGLNTVLSPEEANLPVDVVIKMQKLPPHIPTFQTESTKSRQSTKSKDKTKKVKAKVVDSQKTKKDQVDSLETSSSSDSSKADSGDLPTEEFARDLVNVLPKDIVRALTNGDVLTEQQRQRFIDKITYDIMKAKGVPQPKQIQEIAMQVANMYPRSLVILPQGKRKSNLRGTAGKKRQARASEGSPEPKRAKKDTPAAEEQKIEPKASSSASQPETPQPKKKPRVSKVKATPPTPPKESGANPNQQAEQGSTKQQNGGVATPPKKKGGRPKKNSTVEKTPRQKPEKELTLSLEEQKAWLRDNVSNPLDQQDIEKQSQYLHNCYDMLYKEMADQDYDSAAILEQWPALRKPEHVLSIFKRLKRVHGDFQDIMRRDAAKLVTFLHEKVTTDEGAEWSLRISQAKPCKRYTLPEEIGVMPLLALGFEEDFSLLFKLLPNDGELQKTIQDVEPVPIILGVGESIFSCDYHVVVEQQLLYTTETYLDALELVYAAYFVFNLAYPKELLNTLEYVQRYYVGYNPHIKTVTLTNTRPKIASFLKKLKDFERVDWNSNIIRANSPGVPPEFERESEPEDEPEQFPLPPPRSSLNNNNRAPAKSDSKESPEDKKRRETGKSPIKPAHGSQQGTVI